MKIFITGASGYIGWAVAQRLAKGGHEVTGLTHSPKKADFLRGGGVRPVLGDVKAPDSYRKDADACDALIHLAVEYGPQGPATDKTALEALIASAKAAKVPRLLVYTSGVWVLGPKKAAASDEGSALDPSPLVAWRPAHERLALGAAGGGVAAVVTRPGCVYGGNSGLYGMMFKSIMDEREVRVIGDGSQSWASVYLDDLAEFYTLLVEKRPSGVFHAVSGKPESVRRVAEAFLDAAGGGEVKPWPLAEARKALGPMADALAMDQRVSSDKARRELGWKPALTSAADNAPMLLAQWRDKTGPGCIA